MTRGAGEPSAKRAKVDEEEDPLVRRKDEVVRLLKKASAKGKGKGNAREKKELVTLCTDFEAKNEKLLGRLPPELWEKIVDEYLVQNDELAFAMTCRFFRERQKDLGKRVKTNLKSERLLDLRKSGKMASHTLGWFQWVCDNWEILPGNEWGEWIRVKGAVYEGDLVNYAAFQGSVEILRWLMEEKGWKLNEDTGWWSGQGGSVELLEYLRERAYEFDGKACQGAARGGGLEALKCLRGLDPPCFWSDFTCAQAAHGGHLEVLKWLRAQNPPCPWERTTCDGAATEGHLEVLKWLRIQSPPCPWDWQTCYRAVQGGHLEILKWARSQDPPCPWDWQTCYCAAQGGHLDVLKWARSQDPPCPWNERTCASAAREGRLEVLKWLRDQDPPCPWNWETCYCAAQGGHLEVLKWLRVQDPPCPWRRSTCSNIASDYGHQHFVDWIDQQEDKSDVEFSDYDSLYDE